MSVTVIETDNKAHNVVPAQCKFVVDVRVNELYTFEDSAGSDPRACAMRSAARSTRLRSTSIALDHPLTQAGIALKQSLITAPPLLPIKP